ncbi:MAG TPA: 2-oxoacid:acceptor oxidoreductase family protein [Candidatus Acidoferrum sp.]|nr:2-oxoacid:acceptor oxidoreductase family protein [Candidatus Acidoferrum sp.]
MTKTQILLSGHGGQGVLLLGDYIAYSAVLDEKHVVYTPSYGPETRGGKAKCYVVISESEIDTPIPEEPDLMIILNQPSMDFVPLLARGGLLLYNSSLVEGEPRRDDIKKIRVPATELADSLAGELSPAILGDTKDTRFVANSVMFGAYLGTPTGQTARKHLNETLQHFLGGKKANLLELNRSAVEQGLRYMSNPTARNR